MKRVILIGVAAIMLAGVGNVMAQGKSQDDVPGHECEHGQHTNNPHCDPTDTGTATATAGPTPEVTSTAVPTVVTESGCDTQGVNRPLCPEPVFNTLVTPVPTTAQPTPAAAPRGFGTTPNVPAFGPLPTPVVTVTTPDDTEPTSGTPSMTVTVPGPAKSGDAGLK